MESENESTFLTVLYSLASGVNGFFCSFICCLPCVLAGLVSYVHRNHRRYGVVNPDGGEQWEEWPSEMSQESAPPSPGADRRHAEWMSAFEGIPFSTIFLKDSNGCAICLGEF
jgi:hypothetical protein